MEDHTDGPPTDESLVGGYSGRLFLGISIGWFVVIFGRQLLPPLLPTIMADLDITPFLAGAALTTLFVVRAMAQFPGGRLADQLSRKTILVGSLAVLAIGFVLLGGAIAYPLLLLAAAVVGVGAGAYSVSTRATTADLYVTKRGRAFGLQDAFTSLAGVGAAGGAIVVLAVGTWRSGFLPIAAVLGGGALALHLYHRDSYVVEPVRLDVFETGSRVFGDVEVRRVIGAFVLFVFAWQGTIGFLPTFLQVEKDFSPVQASVGFGLVYVVGVVAAPLAGVIADRYGKVPTSVGALLFGSGGLLALLVVDSLVGVGLSIVGLAIGFRTFFPVAQAHLMDAFSDATMGGDLGAGKTAWSGIGSLGPTYVGLIAGWWNYTIAYAGLVGCLLASLAFIGLVWRSTR